MPLDPAIAARFPLPIAPGAELRHFTLDDLDEAWALVEANRDRLDPWMPWSGGASLDRQRDWISLHLDDLEGLGIWIDGRFVGGVGIEHDPFDIAGEIGYWIDGGYEGRGLVIAAVRALIDIGFRDLGLHRIEIRAAVDNARSRAIPERLGFTREAVLRHAGKGSGAYGFHDMVVYGLLEDEWPPT